MNDWKEKERQNLKSIHEKYDGRRIEIVQALARGYCTEENEKKIVDPDLIEAMADEVCKLLDGKD